MSKKEEQVVYFDRKAILQFKHEINHFKDGLHYMPDGLKSIEWYNEDLKVTISLRRTMEYLIEKLDVVDKYIDLSLGERSLVK
jgi:hypothetical protein